MARAAIPLNDGLAQDIIQPGYSRDVDRPIVEQCLPTDNTGSCVLSEPMRIRPRIEEIEDHRRERRDGRLSLSRDRALSE